VAAILHDRALTLAQFEPERYNDPALKSFAAEKVEVIEDKSLEGVQTIVQAETVDGRTIEVRCDTPRGSPENPLTRAQLESKFRTYARGRISAGRIEEIISSVWKLEDVVSVRSLMNMLRQVDDARVRTSAIA